MRIAKTGKNENKYLHRDFHVSMNILMEYILDRYGETGLKEYLTRFAKAYHKPLKVRLQKEGLAPLAEYMKDIYEKEEWNVKITMDDNRLEIIQQSCPGITQIRKAGHEPVKGYVETYETVYQTICEGTPFEYELIDFDGMTGACTQVFTKRGVS